MQFVTQIAYLDKRPNVRKETAILILLLNSENRELKPLLHHLLRRQKREVHHVFLETVREYAEKVVSNGNLDFWIICLQQLSHIRHLKTSVFPITSLSIENRINFERAIHHYKSMKWTSFNAIFRVLLLTLLSERHLLGNRLPARPWSAKRYGFKCLWLDVTYLFVQNKGITHTLNTSVV